MGHVMQLPNTETFLQEPQVQHIRETDPSLDPDGIEYTIISPEEFDLLTRELIQNLQLSNIDSDQIVSIKRAGVFIGERISKAMHIPHCSIRARRYNGISLDGNSTANSSIEILEDETKNIDLAGKHILLVDEVNHTSTTLLEIRRHLMSYRLAERVTMAVLHEKPKHRKIRAEYYIAEKDNWIIYPWSIYGWEGHIPGEFFAEKFPDWMIRFENGQLTTQTWTECLNRCIKMDFYIEELPDLQNEGFKNLLLEKLRERILKIFPTAKPEELEQYSSQILSKIFI